MSGTASQPESTQLLQPLRERNVMSDEDKTYVKSMLGAEEETNSSEQRVLGVRWNPVDDVFIFELTL